MDFQVRIDFWDVEDLRPARPVSRRKENNVALRIVEYIAQRIASMRDAGTGIWPSGGGLRAGSILPKTADEDAGGGDVQCTLRELAAWKHYRELVRALRGLVNRCLNWAAWHLEQIVGTPESIRVPRLLATARWNGGVSHTALAQLPSEGEHHEFQS